MKSIFLVMICAWPLLAGAQQDSILQKALAQTRIGKTALAGGKLVIGNEPVPGRVVKEEPLAAIGALRWTLSNGVAIILKPTDFPEADISFLATSPGGCSLYSDADYPSASYAAVLNTMGGIGGYSSRDLNTLLQGKKMAIGNTIGPYSADMMGFTDMENLELFLQLNYLLFARPSFDPPLFEANKALLMPRSNPGNRDPMDIFYDTISRVISNYQYRSGKADSAFITKIDIAKCAQIYHAEFGDASGFTFVLAGRFDPEKIRPLIEKYIGSLNASRRKPRTPRDLGMYPPSGKITKMVYGGAEAKASVNLTFSGSYLPTALNNTLLDALKKMMETRVFKQVREDQGVYSPSALAVHENIPLPRYRLRVSFDCADKDAEKLSALMLEEISQLKTTDVTAEALQQFKDEDRQRQAANLESNEFWVNYIASKIISGSDLDEVNQYENRLQKINAETIKEAANRYLSADNLLRFILMPAYWKH